MDQPDPRWIKSASLRPLISITGLLGGLALGIAWEMIRGYDFNEALLGSLPFAFTGSVLGTALVAADIVGRDERGRISTRGWMAVVAVSACAFGILSYVLR